MKHAARLAVLFGFAALGAGCVDSGRRITAVDPEPAPMAATAKRIASDGTGGLILPDGARVMVDQTGGFQLPNGDYVRRDRSGALNLPNGARCLPDGRQGYLCP